ncbi:MAG: hypothetical protein LAP86_29525 [Acidobacteriia bacterium]|nr:hypothetical protein [Terriglobia bacterium]
MTMTRKEELEFMRRMGSRGGKRAAQRMTPAQRKARAVKASRAAAAKRSQEARHGKS